MNEFKERTIEITQSEQASENRLEKEMNRTSGTSGVITKYLIFVTQEYQKERRKKMRLNYLKK